MAQSLAWRILTPEDTYLCLQAHDVPGIRTVLKSVEAITSGKLIHVSKYNEGQQMIFYDMLGHLILFAKARQMSLEKVSTLIGIVVRLHEESMANSLTRAQSYHMMRELMVQHSVPRPPFSCGIFTVGDVEDIDDYLLQSYYRHYKMYVYAFVPQEIANIKPIHVDHIHEIPPVGLPSLVAALEENEWRAKVEELNRAAELARMGAEEEASEAAEMERMRVRMLNDPRYSDGIREQLTVIKKEVTGQALSRLDEIEMKLSDIERRLAESPSRSESRQNRGMQRRRWAATTAVPLIGLLRIARRRLHQNAKSVLETPAAPRRLRLVSSSIAGAAQDPLPVDVGTRATDPNDPYNHVQIFRKEMTTDSGNRGFQLSVDVPLKKFVDLFSDFDSKRCKLCNENYAQWHSHSSVIPHSGREALMLEMVRAYCGTPEEIAKMWWHRLSNDPVFNRIPALSHDNSHIRKRRLQYLLKLLKDRDVIRDTFNVQQSAGGAGRSWEFERLEWIGDNVVKYVFNDRFNVVFPVREGGIRGRLGYAQFMIDGNDGLARAYDFLELQKLTLSDRVVSKFKSDVVETLFGELQLFIWSTETDIGTEYLELPFTGEMYPLRTIVWHVMEELAHVMFMYHVDHILAAIQRVVREHQLQFIRADPALRGQAELQSELASSLYAKRTVNGSSRLTATKIAPNLRFKDGFATLYQESSNYDAFKRVSALGGLLPRPFARSALAATPLYLPQLQEDNAMSRRVLSDWPSKLMDLSLDDDSQRQTMNALSLESIKRSNGSQPLRLGVPELKDALLITELF